MIFLRHSKTALRTDLLKSYARHVSTKETVLNKFPLLGDKKTLPHTYIVDEDLAQAVVQKLNIDYNDKTPIVEVNPGPCILTTALLKAGSRNLCSVEARKEFTPILDQLAHNYGQQFSYLRKDFFRSLFIHDKSYELTRSLRNFQSASFKEPPPLKVIFTCGNWELENRVMLSLLHGLVKRRDSIFSLGRVQFISFLSYREYLYWTLQHPYPVKSLYRWRTAVQSLFFDVETLMQVPVNSFSPQPKVKTAKMSVFKSENPNMLYLVRFTPKFNLHEEILEERYMPLFQFFLKDLLSSRNLRLIPKLDQWFPNIGFDLIREDFTMTQTVNDCSPQELLHVFKLVIESSDLEKSGFMSAFLQDHPMNLELWKSF